MPFWISSWTVATQIDTMEEKILLMEERHRQLFSRDCIFMLRRELFHVVNMGDPTEDLMADLSILSLVDANIYPYMKRSQPAARNEGWRYADLSHRNQRFVEQRRQGAITRRLAAWAA
jgi:hypothetical protein